MLPVVLFLFELSCFKLLFPLVAGTGGQGRAADCQQNQDVMASPFLFIDLYGVETRLL